MSIQIIFTSALLDFLKKESYTHLQLRGIIPESEASNGLKTEEDYILVPWKESLKKFDEADFQMEEINSTDITDMLDVEFGIQFLVELPEPIAARFQNSVG